MPARARRFLDHAGYAADITAPLISSSQHLMRVTVVAFARDLVAACFCRRRAITS